MPQTKPMSWIKLFITVNILFMFLLMKMFQSINKKTKLYLKLKFKSPTMKW